MRERLLPVWVALSMAALTACSGTGDGGTGDAPSTIEPSRYGQGLRLSDVLGPATWLNSADTASDNCSSPAERSVVVSGVTVIAIDDYDETGDGARGNIYAEDTSSDPLPYSGVTVFDPSFTPPNLRLVAGDAADLSGVLSEFIGPSSGKFGYCRTLPEIGGTMAFRFDAGGVPPKTIPLSDLKSYETARPWLGMLVRVEGIKIAKDPANSGGRFTAELDVGGGIEQSDVPKISNELYDLAAEGPALAAGATFQAVTGVITYFYGFKLVPRSPADFEP